MSDAARAERFSENKRAVSMGLRAIVESPAEDRLERIDALYHSDATTFAFCPVDHLSGVTEIYESLWQPLLGAIDNASRQDRIIVSGEYQSREMVAIHGTLNGTLARDLFDIPAGGESIQLRYCEVHSVEAARISHSWILVDLLDLMRQVGCWPLAPSTGREVVWPEPKAAPATDSVDLETGQQTLDVTLAMQNALGEFDGDSLDSMPHNSYWADGFGWYGPAGIGVTHGMTEFRAHHQIPFLLAFPDRRGGDHYVRMGDGAFSVTGGWPSVRATHTGGNWMGMPPTGKFIGMRVMDFYRCEDGKLAENWVPIDIIDILRQMGVDVFARLRHLTGRFQTTL